MTPNPYAPPPPPGYGPPGPPGAPPPPPGVAGEGGAWTASEVLSAAWAAFGPTWLMLVAAVFMTQMAAQIAGLPGIAIGVLAAAAHVPPTATHTVVPQILRLALSAPASLLVSVFFQVGLTRLVLQIARGETARFEVLFAGADRFLPMLGLQLLMMVALLLGFALLIVPGIVLGIRWSLAPYYVVDANLGPVDALEASWEATRDRSGALVLLLLAICGISLLGLACCCVGLVAAMPLGMLILATAYVRTARRPRSEAPFPPMPEDDWRQGSPPWS